MPLIQEAKITFQQSKKKRIIFFCLTCISKMELKWEILIFRDFTGHTLCKYAHHHVNIEVSLKRHEGEEACTVWLSPTSPWHPDRLASARVQCNS